MTAANPPPTSAEPVPFACRLPHLGSLCFEGPDAPTFLQGQLSSDLGQLGPGRLQRSSYNSPKGRVLADLVLWRSAQDREAVHALVAADLAPATAKRLAMFVLRAKVRVTDATTARVRLGVGGADAPAVVLRALGARPEHGSVVVHDDTALLGLPDGRVIVEVEVARADAVLKALAAHAETADPGAWLAADVRAGVPLVTAVTSDQFVPQALNLDVLGAVSFRKGCYPGQEIVARMQYLGRLKERLFAFGVDTPAPNPGTRLYAPTFGDQPCGTIVTAAPAAGDASRVLAVVQRAAVDAGDVHLGALDGPALSALPLPYDVPEPAAPRGRIAQQT
jgi:folate-binding protein YgfZ